MPAPFEQQPTPSETAVSAATQVASNDKGDELQAARLGRSPSSANIEQQLSHDQQAWAPSAATQLGRSRVDLPPPSPRSLSPLKAELEAATAQLRAATQQVRREMGLGIGGGRSARIAHHPTARVRGGARVERSAPWSGRPPRAPPPQAWHGATGMGPGAKTASRQRPSSVHENQGN